MLLIYLVNISLSPSFLLSSAYSDSDLRVLRLFIAFRIIVLSHNGTTGYFCHFGLWTHLRFLVIFCVFAAYLTVLVKAKVLHLEAPFYSVEWVVAQRWRQHSKERFCSKYFKQIVTDARECEIIVVALITCISTHKFNCGEA